MSAGNAKRRAVCCACGAPPTVDCAGPYLWGTSDAERTVTSPFGDHISFTEGGAGGGYLWAGEMKWALPDGSAQTHKVKCHKYLIWEACTLITTAGGTKYDLTGSDTAGHILRIPGQYPAGSDGSLRAAYAVGGSPTSGPWLDTRPDYWPCLQVAGISGDSIWCEDPLLSDMTAFLRGEAGTQGAAPWFAPGYAGSYPLVVGRRYDLALLMTFAKHATSGASGGTWVYQAASDGMAFLSGIALATHDIDLSTYPNYGGYTP